MSFKKKVFYNIIIQAIGPGLAFLIVFLLAKFFGPNVQGSFAKFKAFVDFIVGIGTFGFPQSFVYLINKLNVPPRRLALLSLTYSFISILLTLGIITTFIYFDYIDINAFNNSKVNVLILSVICCVLILQQLWRGVYLGYNSGLGFAFLSILPPVFLFFAVIISVYRLSFTPFNAYFIASVPIFIIIWLVMLPILKQKNLNPGVALPWMELWRHGTHAFLQSLVVILQPIIAYWLIKRYIGQDREIGFFNVGLFFIQGFIVPIGMVSPLLFERWTKSTNISGLLQKFQKLTPKLLVADIILGLFLSGSIYIIIPILFSRQYLASILLSQILLFTVPLMLHGRVILPAIHAGGYPNLNTHSGFIRIITFFLIAFGFIHFNNLNLVKLAVSWSVAEVIASLYTLICLRNITKSLT